MKLYNQIKDKVEDVNTVLINGVNMYVDKIDEADLNTVGLFKIEYGTRPNRRYYTVQETKGVLNGKYRIDYIGTAKSLAEVQAVLLSDLEDEANKRFNEATSGYTPAEMSSWAEMEAQARENLVTPLTSGMLYDEAMLSGITVDELANKVIVNADALKQLKSYIAGNRKRISTEISALVDVPACILYEATPYDYTVTAEDVANDVDGTLVEGVIITKFKNNIKEW